MEELAAFGRAVDEPRQTLGPGIKNSVRALEKISNDYGGGWVLQKKTALKSDLLPNLRPSKSQGTA